MSDQRRVFIVPHTHWDREWYQPFERFRMRLAALIDDMIDKLQSEPEFAHFTLDGHTIPIEDYAAVRPERIGELTELIRRGRVGIGPWYVLPDEFLTSGEAAIRNLQLGHRLAAKYGRPMKVGYIPDTFGHAAQIPQILRGFDLDNAVIWRGVPAEVEHTEFRWQAPDGSSVVATFMPNGYSNAVLLPGDPDELAKRVEVIDGVLTPLATTPNLLYMNGTDHLHPQPDLVDVAQKLRQLTGREVRIATIEHYQDAVRRDLAGKSESLQTFEGELRSPRWSQLLPNVMSTRHYIKQANARCESLYESWAEPAAAMAHVLTGREYHRGLLGEGWRLILQNHPHDSICGCSVDLVHDEMMTRFGKAEQIGYWIVQDSLTAVAEDVAIPHVDAMSAAVDESATGLVVFNPHARARDGVVSASITYGRTLMRRQVPRTSAGGTAARSLTPNDVPVRPLPAITLVDAAGNRVPTQIVSTSRSIDLQTSPQYMPVNWLVDRAEVLFAADSVPGLGYKAYRVEVGASSAAPVDGVRQIEQPLGVENDFVRVEVESGGTVRITDRRTGRSYPGCHRLVDGGERGDEYTYCPPESDSLYGLSDATARVVESGALRSSIEIRGVLRIPARLTDGRSERSDELVDCAVSTRISLMAGSARVEFRTDVDNRAEDHRLRVAFPTGIHQRYCDAEAQFAVLRRSLDLPTGTEGWPEQPNRTAPTRGFVDISDGEAGLALITRGLIEYEAAPEDTGIVTYLTLLRSVGWLSRGDMWTRPAYCGPGMPAPGAQCLGRQVFEYSIVPHGGDWRQADLVGESADFRVPPRAVDVARRPGEGSLPPEFSLVAVEPSAMRISALKWSEEGNRLIVRAYNASPEPATATFRPYRAPRSVDQVNLNEEVQRPLAIGSDGAVTIEVRKWEIVTLAFDL